MYNSNSTRHQDTQHSIYIRTTRSRAYNEWLKQQSPDYRHQLVTAERGYLREIDNPIGGRATAAQAFAESLTGLAP
jgi:hypothetical protein